MITVTRSRVMKAKIMITCNEVKVMNDHGSDATITTNEAKIMRLIQPSCQMEDFNMSETIESSNY